MMIILGLKCPSPLTRKAHSLPNVIKLIAIAREESQIYIYSSHLLVKITQQWVELILVESTKITIPDEYPILTKFIWTV